MNLFGAPTTGFVIESEPVVRAGHPVMSPDGRALWDRSQGWFWVVAEPDEETFYVSLDADGPYPAWMQYILDTEGIGSEMFPDCYTGEQFAAALLAEGIAPDQPFFVHMTFAAGTDYYACVFGEGWTEIDWTLLDVEKLDPTEAARRWETWLAEWRREHP